MKNRFPIDGKKLVILYFGDHDPSGFDIEDSLKERLKAEAMKQGIYSFEPEFERIGLTDDQIGYDPSKPVDLQKYLPSIPIEEDKKKRGKTPNKEKKNKKAEYIKKYGRFKWELDVLPPKQLVEIAELNIRNRITNLKAWDKKAEEVKAYKEKLQKKYIHS